MNRSTATRWKNGTTPTADSIEKLSKLLDVSYNYLMGKTDNPDSDIQLNPLDESGKLPQKEKSTIVSDDGLKEFLQEPYIADILETLKKLTPDRQRIALLQLQALVDTGNLEEAQGK